MMFVNDINCVFETMVLADQDDWQPCFSALLLIGCWLVDILCPVLAKCYYLIIIIYKFVTISSLYVCMAIKHIIVLFVETPH
jgi:hypothetical protein